jgi:phosphonate transport system substrate-binding protein
MLKYWRPLVLLALSAAPLGLCAAPGGETPQAGELRFGSVAMDIPAEMYRRLTPLTRYLSDTLGRSVTLKLAPNMAAAIDDVSRGDVEIAYLTPVAYIESHARGNTRLVAKTVTNGKSSFHLMIVVREDSPIRRIEDLKGKSFAFGDRAALLQRAVVVGAGLPLEKLKGYQYLEHYDNIARGVSSGDFDAGVLKDTTAFKWQGRGLRILYTSPALPPYNITVSSKVDDKLFVQIRQAFLSLNINNPGHRGVIQALDKDYDGFAPASDGEYSVVRKLIAPFATGQ